VPVEHHALLRTQRTCPVRLRVRVSPGSCSQVTRYKGPRYMENLDIWDFFEAGVMAPPRLRCYMILAIRD
jgi:hypothetical protein